MFFNRLLKSFYFWIVVGILGLFILITKGKPSKLIAIFKVLGNFILKLLDLIFALFNLKIERLQNFQEATEI